MEPVNGTTEPKAVLINGINGKAHPSEQKKPAGEPPVKTIPNGRVLTRIWAEKNILDEFRWRVSQIRTGSDSRGDGEYRSLHLSDLWDGIRGLLPGAPLDSPLRAPSGRSLVLEMVKGGRQSVMSRTGARHAATMGGRATVAPFQGTSP